MPVVRTPEDRFENLPDYPFQSHYVDIPDDVHGPLRMHYVAEGPENGPITLLLHGEPSWSYLYRHMIPPLAKTGARVIVPDLIGFGKSDKPTNIKDYSYEGHLAWLTAFLDALNLQDITLFCQDWGGLLGLRLVANQPERFARVMAANTALASPGQQVPGIFKAWRAFATYSPWFPIGGIIKRGSYKPLSDGEVAAFDAPFPNARYKAGARAFPALVPIAPGPDMSACAKAWEVLEQFDKPFATAFGNKDPMLGQAWRMFAERVPGAKDQDHSPTKGAGHFLQNDAGAELANRLAGFMGLAQA